MGSTYALGGGSGGSGTTSDAAGTPVIGTPGAPVTLANGVNFTAQATLTDVTAYSQCTWQVIITNRDTATPTARIDVRIDWTSDSGTVFSPQGTEAISAGVATLSVYEAQYDITPFPTASVFSLPPIPLPVIAPGVRIRVRADAGSTDAYVLVTRQV